ncbi:cytidine deaminase-like protein [Trichoderma austrokoningii]
MMDSSASQDRTTAMQHALDLAKKSPPQPTNFRVGAILMRLEDGHITAEGYTLELPGNTHAEECCLLKLAEEHSTTEEDLSTAIKSPHALYTTVEPCFKRLSGKLPCVERILRQKSWIKKVYVGVLEPETFVGKNPGRQLLEDGGVEVHYIPGFEEEILAVAAAGHTSS